jgi:signal transduction histidine kinase
MLNRGVILAKVLETRAEDIAQRFADRLYQSIASTALDRDTVIDSLRDFLHEIVAGLRADETDGRVGAVRADSLTAREHGRQRFQLGFDVGSVIREYGALRDIIFLTMEESGEAFTVAEMRSLSWYLVAGIADAATKYAQERDAELRRQAGRHVAFLAHELRNPLASMKLAFAKLERESALPAGHRSATILRNGLMRLTELIDHTLLEVKLTAGGDLHLEDLDLDAFLQELETEVAGDVEEKQITVALELTAERLRADRKFLYAALSNLLRNAVKFTQVGGTIRLRAKESENADRVIFEVEDQCGGLPEGNVQRLFDPFVQLGQDRSGFGLGLAIAKQAVDAHDGVLRVHDVPGHGCVFVLELPTAGPREPMQR